MTSIILDTLNPRLSVQECNDIFTKIGQIYVHALGDIIDEDKNPFYKYHLERGGSKVIRSTMVSPFENVTSPNYKYRYSIGHYVVKAMTGIVIPEDKYSLSDEMLFVIHDHYLYVLNKDNGVQCNYDAKKLGMLFVDALVETVMRRPELFNKALTQKPKGFLSWLRKILK